LGIAETITVLVRSDSRIITLGAMTEQIRAAGREVYVDRRLENLRLFVPPGNHDAEALLHVAALATGLEVRRVGILTMIAPSQDDKGPQIEEEAELDHTLAESLKDLLATEGQRMREENIPFEIGDFLSHRNLSFDQLTTRQREFVQQMFLRQKAWEEFLALGNRTRGLGGPGKGFSFRKRYNPSPNEDLSKLPEVQILLIPTYDVGVQTYRAESPAAPGQVKYHPFYLVNLTF